MTYSLYLISNKPQYHNVIQSGLGSQHLEYFDGSNVANFSQLVNTCVEYANTETVILMSDKVRPTQEHVDKTLSLLEQGYAFVGLQLFRFFAFKKQLFRQIGCMDERYVGTGHEDYDLYVRLIEHNLPFWIEESVPWDHRPSSWADSQGVYRGYTHWCTKWLHHWVEGQPLPVCLERTMAEESYGYDFGPEQPVSFLSGRDCFYTTNWPHVGAFLAMDIVSGTNLRYNRIQPSLQIGK